MKIIHCSLWGDIEVSDLALSIIDTPVFQRLHEIKQNGFAYKVFPTATTTRFAHSIGVYHLTKILIEHIIYHQPELEINDSKELICIAGLCHDLGHGPWSHWFDQFLKNMIDEPLLWCEHENRSMSLFRYLVQTYNIALTPDQVDFVCHHIHNHKDRNWYSNIIHNPEEGLDTDKMDYLLRDLSAFGLKFKYDPYRIIKNTRVIQNRLCFCDRVRDEIFNIFFVRNKMYTLIYFHPTIQKFDQSFSKILLNNDTVISEIKSTISEQNHILFIKMTDSWMMQKMDQDLLDVLARREWRFFEPFYIKKFTDQQFYLFQNIEFFNKKNPNIFFRFEDNDYIYHNLMSCQEPHYNHDKYDE